MKTVGTMLSVCFIVPGGTARALKAPKGNGDFYQQVTVFIGFYPESNIFVQKSGTSPCKSKSLQGRNPSCLVFPDKVMCQT